MRKKNISRLVTIGKYEMPLEEFCTLVVIASRGNTTGTVYDLKNQKVVKIERGRLVIIDEDLKNKIEEFLKSDDTGAINREMYQKLAELFPRHVRNESLSTYRSNYYDVQRRYEYFRQICPGYSFEDVVKATKLYVQSYDDPTFMKSLDNFIFDIRQQTSTLATMLEHLSVIEKDEIEYEMTDEGKQFLFEEFMSLFDIYKKKVGDIEKLFGIYRRLSSDDRQKMKTHIPKYVSSTPDKRYRKNFETYMTEKVFNNEIIPYSKKDESMKANDIWKK